MVKERHVQCLHRRRGSITLEGNSNFYEKKSDNIIDKLMSPGLSENDTRHIGSIWPSSDPTSRFLDEALVAFTKVFKVPPTPHAVANELTKHLNGIQGPLPLIAFDYNTPSSSELQILITHYFQYSKECVL